MAVLDDELIAFVRIIAKKAARSFYRSPFYEDCIEAGVECAVRAARSHDESLGVPLRAFLTLRVRGAVWDEARKMIYSRSMQRRGTKTPLSIDALAMPTDDGPGYQFVDWQVEIADRVADAMLLDYLLKSFGNNRERFIVHERVMRGRTQEDVARDLGLTNSRVSRIERSTQARARARAEV